MYRVLGNRFAQWIVVYDGGDGRPIMVAGPWQFRRTATSYAEQCNTQLRWLADSR